jgi:hypothetical protein
MGLINCDTFDVAILLWSRGGDGAGDVGAVIV